MRRTASAVVASCMILGAFGAHAELLISGNDGHQPPEAGQPPHVVPDTVAVLDFSDSGQLKLLGSVQTPASVLGPPAAVFVSSDEKWAVVTAGSKADPANPGKTTQDDVVTVLDIATPSRPRVVQTLHVGRGVSSIAVNRTHTLALTSNTNDDSVSIFTISGNRLTPAGKVQVEQGSRPWCITFMPDGKTALLSSLGGAGLQKLVVDGTNVTNAGPIAGIRSTMAIGSPDGKYIIANGAPAPVPSPAPGAGAVPAGRGGRAAPQVSVLDPASGAVLGNAPLGAGTEFIGFSRDGNYLAATITNGSHSAPASAGFNDFGLLRVYKASGNNLTQVAEAHTGHWCQGAMFSRDGHTILLQCSVEREIEVFRFDGNATLTRDAAATVKFDAAPAAMATASSR